MGVISRAHSWVSVWFPNISFRGINFLPNTFYDEIFVIQKSISSLVKSQNTLLKNMATNMQTKFEKYWGEGDKINPFLYVAVVLDPQKKIKVFEVFFFWNLWECSGRGDGW